MPNEDISFEIEDVRGSDEALKQGGCAIDETVWRPSEEGAVGGSADESQ
jgi:hypothetical protein